MLTLIDYTPLSEYAKELDNQVPGWADRVDTSRLHIDSAGDCILAQLFGPEDGYTKGRALFLNPMDHVPRGWPFVGNATNREAWVREIEKRRTA